MEIQEDVAGFATNVGEISVVILDFIGMYALGRVVVTQIIAIIVLKKESSSRKKKAIKLLIPTNLSQKI